MAWNASSSRSLRPGRHALHDDGPVAVGGLGPVQASSSSDANALGCAELVMFRLGGDTLQRAQRTGDEHEHGRSSEKGTRKMPKENRRKARQRRIGEAIFADSSAR